MTFSTNAVHVHISVVTINGKSGHDLIQQLAHPLNSRVGHSPSLDEVVVHTIIQESE